jgi:2-O-(6-phospho-alpha-D-mannosyl)-D-glycerate hydrolase
MGGLIFHLIAHTHWDREWYLPRAAFHARLVPVLDDLLARLQADPGYRSFLLDGQTVLLEDYLRARPEREGDVRALVKTGRLQVGPWYVLADEQIPSAESLIRNLLLGAADAERLGGRLDVLYSPDAFGHPAAWPAVAREFGVRSGVLWRGRGGEEDVFRWAAPDGREVITWQLPPQGYEIGAALPTDPGRLAEAWPPVRAALVERARGRHVAVFVGADHHAARADLPRLRDALAALEPEHAVRVSRLDEFLQGVAAEAAEAPVHIGELRWSYGYTWTLQGVHGTRLPLKRRNSEAELWLERFAEPLAALARRHGGRDRRPLLDVAWRTLVRGHFHDVIAGCCSDAVAAALETRLTSVEAYAREITRGALFELIGEEPDDARERTAPRGAIGTLALWNPTPRPRGGVIIADLTFFRRHVLIGPPSSPAVAPVEVADTPPFTLRTADGRAVALQVLDRRVGLERRDAERHYPDLDEVETLRVALRAPTTPGLGFVALEATPGGGADGSEIAVGGKGSAAVRGRSLVNRFVEVALEPTGALALHDRRSGERYFDLLRIEDSGDAGDTYSYCPPVRDRLVRSEGPIAVRRLAAGPLLTALEARWTMPAADLRLVVMLHADSPIVRCALEIDNHALDHRMRARIPTALSGGMEALAGTAFGVVGRRPVAVDPAEFPLETPVATAPAHRFVAAAAGRRGLALLAPGFFEYEWTVGGDLILTLLRAVGELSRGDLPSRPGHAGWPTPTPAAQCPGRQRIEVALVTVGEEDLARGDVVPQHWEEAFLPVRGYWLREVIGASPTTVDITLEGTGLVASAVKPAHTGGGSGILLRCYNATGRPAAGAWRFGEAPEGGGAIKTAHRVRADEREPAALVLEERGRTVRFTAAPGEMVTIWVT